MKIAVCMNEFPKLSEKFILYQIKGLIELGHEVHVAAFWRSREAAHHPEISRYRLLEKADYLFEKHWTLRFPWGLFGVPAMLIRLLLFYPREFFRCACVRKTPLGRLENLCILDKFVGRNIDVIHCHFGTVARQLVFLKWAMPSVRFVTTFHLYDLQEGMESRGGQFHELFQMADRIFAICSYNRQRLKALGCPEEKLVDLHNSIDTGAIPAKLPQSGSKRLTVTTVARLVEAKNIFFGLKVIKGLKDRWQDDFEYQLIGDGPLRGEIENAIRDLRLGDQVKLLGALPSDKVMERLQESDIFFLPSQLEAFPTVLLEAQAVGIPVVATDVGGAGETMQHEVTGYLVPNNNVEAAVSRIGHLLDHPELRVQFGKAGRRFMQDNFDIMKLNRKLTELYQSCALSAGSGKLGAA